jgi:hypothetical protein
MSNTQKLTKEEQKRYEALLEPLKRPKGRDYTNVAIVGRRRRGKSTLQRILADSIHGQFKAANRERKILIVDLAPAGSFTDLPTFKTIRDLKKALIAPVGSAQRWTDGIWKIQPKLDEIKELTELLIKYFRNGLIFWDEANKFLERNGGLPDWQLPLFSTNGNLGIDNFICVHRLMDIPKSIRTHIERFIVFAVDDPFTKGKDLAANAFPGPHDEFFELIDRVRKESLNEDSKVKYYEIFYVN